MLVRIPLAVRKEISILKPRASEVRVAARKCPDPRLHPEVVVEEEAVRAVVVAVLREAEGGVHENRASARRNRLQPTREDVYARQNKV